MARKSAFWAATHGCYNLWTGKYHCPCGKISSSVKEHDQHVLEAHFHDVKLIYHSVSWKTWEKWQKKYGFVAPEESEEKERVKCENFKMHY